MTMANNKLPVKEMIERQLRIVELTRMGRSLVDIADIVGVSTRTVVRVRDAYNIRNRQSPQRFTSEEVEIAERLLEDGASFGEVARTLRRPQSTIFHRFKGRSQWRSGNSAPMREMHRMLNSI